MSPYSPHTFSVEFDKLIRHRQEKLYSQANAVMTKHQNDKQQVQHGNATGLISLANAFQLKLWAGFDKLISEIYQYIFISRSCKHCT